MEQSSRIIMNEFWAKKGIKRYSIARTPQQNGVAKKRIGLLLEAARTIVEDPSTYSNFGSEESLCLLWCLKSDNQKGKGPDWMFDLDLLTPSMNYIPVRKENYADSKEQGITCADAEDLDDQQFIVHTTQPIPPEESTAAKEVKLSSEDQALHDELVSLMHQESLAKTHNDDQRIAFEEEKRRISIAKGKEHVDSTFTLSTANTPPQSTGNTPTDSDDDTPTGGVFSTNSFDDEEGGVADYNNLDPSIDVPSTPTLRIHKIHPQSQIIGKSTAGVQTRRKLQDSTSNQHQALLSFIYKQNRTNHKDQQTCLFACFLSQEEPKKVSQALADESWVEAMQEELLQFKLQEVWVLCDLPEGKRVIGTKWVFRNKRDERVARIEAIRLFLAFASFMGFIVYQMDVKSAFLYGNITEEVYVKQPPGFEDPAHPNKVYKVVKALYGLHQAPRAWYERLSTFLLKHGYRRGAIDKTLFIKKDRRDIMLIQVYVDDIIFGSTKSSMVKDFEELMQKEFKMSSTGELTFFLGLQVKQSNAGIFLSQDKYVKDILNKFDFRTIKPASTPMEAHKSLGKYEEGEDVDVHLYRSMIGCLMYLTASRQDIMFAVCLCVRFQVTPKVSHLHAIKRIFRYLKHQPKLGLWYPKDSPFHLEAFSDSDYARDNHDRRSTSRGCQYLGRRLVSWQCKNKQLWLYHLQRQNMSQLQVVVLRWNNADFHQIIDYLAGCSINYSLLVDPDLIGPWLQQFWATASLRVINEVPHIRATVAGKKILISEATIRADLLFDDADGVDCFPKQVIWDSLRDIGYEGNLAQLTFSKPLFSPQWKYLVHVLLHCLSPKSTSWEQFGTNIASALVGLATNQKFNFSLLIMNGMLGHISNGTPFIMYPRFIQLFLNKQLEGVTRPTNFLPSVTLPSKVFTFMRKNSPKFSGRITPLTPPMLEVVTALAAEEAHSTSPHSRAASSPRDAQGTPSQSAAHDSNLQGTAASQGTASLQGTAESQGTAAIPKSPNDYTPTDASQTSGGDEGLLDLYALNREVRRLKKQTLSQAKQIHKLKAKLKKLSKFVQPVVKHHALWVESQNLKKRRKRQRKKHKKKVSSVKVGRNKDEGTLSEEHYVQDDYTADPFFEDIVDKDAAVTPDLERKSDETEEINIEEKEASNVKSGDTEELDLETVGIEDISSTARQSTITPRTLTFDDEAGPSSPIRPTQEEGSEEQLKVDEVLADISLTCSSEKEKALMGSEKEKQLLQERDAKRLLRKRKEEIKLRTETIDALRNYLRIDLYHLYRVVQGYYEHIPPTGLGLVLLGDLTTIWETPETSDDDFWKNQEDWEIIRWRLNESSGVHTLELEDGTMIHMLAERRYPLSRELMIRMLDHGMEVEDESETAITLIHLFILWTTEDGDNS
ncbi:putative ribonuclease H-like domain-containing protein [Tanacetum coccineum]